MATNGASVSDGNAVTQQDAQERAVGISVFVQPDTRGFKAIVKHRYTDFLVNEIQLDGNVLHLSEVTSADQGKKRKRDNNDEVAQKKKRLDDATKGAAGAATQNGDSQAAKPTDSNGVTLNESTAAVKEEAIASISDEDKTTLKNVFGEATVPSILNLYASVIAHPDRKPREHPTVNSQPLTEKSQRTEAHLCIRRIFKSKLETLTIQDQAQQSGPGTIISLKAAPPKAAHDSNTGNHNANGQRGAKEMWSDLGGEYLHFSLYKENKDTMEVLHFLASQVKMHTKHFSFAGTKDRRGVTVQRVAVHRMKRERLEGLNRIARGWRIGGPWEYRPNALELGMLGGNEFLLTLRDAKFEGEEPGWDMARRLEYAKQVAQTAARGLSETGYLNYYGLQRFGSYATGTHVVGMRMLKNDLKGAVDAILSYDPSLLEENQSPNADGERKLTPQDDVSRATAIRNFVNNGSPSDSLSRLPHRFNAERSIITHQGKQDRKTGKRPNANDFQGALMAIQRNLRLMYVHAYQSFVWNTVAGKRWETYGARVVEGDLIVVGEKDREEGADQSTTIKADEVDENGEPIIHPSATAPSTSAAGAADDLYVRARPLSNADAESGRYTIFDIVLPLPGFDVLYPSNEIGKFYEVFMASEQGGGLDPHSMRRPWKDISLSGGYRKMMSRPLGDGVDVDVRAYSSPEEQMVETDLEKLEKLEKSTEENAIAADHSHPPAEQDKIAVILKLQLGSSQYATMALRELTKGGATGYRPEFSAPNR